MGIFNKKSKQSDAGSIDTARSTNSPRNSAAIQSPRFPQSSASLTGSISDIPLPKPPDGSVNPVAYLRSIYAVRQSCGPVFDKAKNNKLLHFDVDMSKFNDTAAYVVSIIKRDYAPEYSQIPPHGRWQHFAVGGRDRIEELLKAWPKTIDSQERTRRLIDLFLVSVLLDAGAGNRWQYKSKENNRIYRRSEGLAIASLEMFKAGFFSSEPSEPQRVDGQGLKGLTIERLAKGLQISDTNKIEGLEGRAGVLIRLGDALLDKEIYFGKSSRPGNLLDYLISHESTHAASVPVIPIPTFWDALMDGLAPVWPSSRTRISGNSLGDAWPCETLPRPTTTSNNPVPGDASWETICAFHKLTQWLTYSLMTPMTRLMNIQFAGSDLLTGLPEYRNGGLLIDTGLLTLKPEDMERGLSNYKNNAKTEGQPNMEVVPLFSVDDDVIVEWRALTVCFLDALLSAVNKQLGLTGLDSLSLAQMLEAGTWKGGRELAEVSRPNTKEPPIMIISDGTVF